MPGERAGRRDKLVTIQGRPSADDVDAGGLPAADFTDRQPAVWMSKQDPRGTESFTENQVMARVDTEWHMPYRPDMDPELLDVPKLRRLVYQGRVYDIAHASLEQRSDGRGIVLFTVTTSKHA